MMMTMHRFRSLARRQFLGAALLLALGLLAACHRNEAPKMSARATLIAYNDASSARDSVKLLPLCSARYASALRPQLSQFLQACYAAPAQITVLGEDKKSDSVTVIAFLAAVRDRATSRLVAQDTVLCELILEENVWKISTFQTGGAGLIKR